MQTATYITSNKKIAFPLILLCLYLCISPIYWLPGISYSLIKYFKIAVIFAALSLFLMNKGMKGAHQIALPMQLFIPFFFIILLFIPFLIISLKNGMLFQEIFLYYLNFPFGFLTAFMAYNYYDTFLENSKLFKIPFLFLSFLCLFPISYFFYGVPDWISPFTLESGLVIDTFWSTGFNASRTGWSGSLACFVPLGFLFLSKKNDTYSLLDLVFFIFIISLIFASQAISLGRGGMLGSTISIIIISAIYFGKKGIIAIFLSLVIVFFSFKNEILLALRISDIEGNIQNLDDISSVRTQINRETPSIFFEKPFFGHGYNGNLKLLQERGGATYEGLEIHNTFLNLLTDNGIFMGLIILFISGYAIYVSIRLLKNKKNIALFHLTSCIIISGLIIAMFEPHAIFSSFQQAPFWWVALGLNLKLFNNQNKANTVV